MKTKELIESFGLIQQELSGKFFVQALDKVSIEDEESLQDKWATLLSNASTGQARADIKYVNILSDLEADEVRFLTTLYTVRVKVENAV